MIDIEKKVEDDSESRITRPRRSKKIGNRYIYGCKTTISIRFKGQFNKRYLSNDIMRSVISKNWKRYIGNDAVDIYYYYYTLLICSALELKTKRYNYKEIVIRLDKYNDTITSSSLDSLKLDEAIYW